MSSEILINDGVLSGIITSDGVLSGTIQSESVLEGFLSVPTGYEDYTDSYIITPAFCQQIMETADKHMTNDVTIESIPYSEVTNPSGGLTINIGG